jgi:hypothetical protein
VFVHELSLFSSQDQQGLSIPQIIHNSLPSCVAQQVEYTCDLFIGQAVSMTHHCNIGCKYVNYGEGLPIIRWVDLLTGQLIYEVYRS